MKENPTAFTQEEKYLVKKLYEEGYSVLEISQIVNLSFYETIYVLKHMIEDINVKELVFCTNITDSQLLIISDTHLGSIYENLDYLKKVYQLAEENDIHTIIHGGDLLQSTCRNVKEEYLDEKKQIDHIKKEYPFSNKITNYILLGNHDYNTLKKGDYYLDSLQERKDFYLLGFKRAYFSWQNQLISICHPIKKYHLSIPSVENDLNLKGHSHKLSYNKVKSIDIPTLSDDLLIRKNARPGFLLGTLKGEVLEMNSYYFQENNLYQEGPILKKSIKK